MSQSWGKKRIADELVKGNNWIPLVSPNTVRRILRDAGLWPKPAEPAKKEGPRPEAERLKHRVKHSISIYDLCQLALDLAPFASCL